jgi:outer membrane protein assembly factor BamB/orotate phosphoribosyltransferase
LGLKLVTGARISMDENPTAKPKNTADRTDEKLELLREQIRTRSIIHWSESEPIYSSTGKRFDWLFDFRPIVLDGKLLQIIADLFWDRMERFWPFQIATLELGGVPLLSGIALEGERRGFPTNALVIRQKRKKYGRARLIEGEPKADLPVVLVDDSINTARSINKVLIAIEDQGLASHHAFAIAHFFSSKAAEWSKETGVLIHYLVSPQDFSLPVNNALTCKSRYALKWTFASPAVNYRFAVPKSTPALYGDSLLFGSDSGVFWCLEKTSGRIRWWYNVSDHTRRGIVSSPLVIQNKVYFGAYNGTLYCLSAETGHEQWKIKGCDWIGSSPCYANGSIFIGLEFNKAENKGALASFSAENGEPKWQIFTKQMLHGSPVYSEMHNLVIIGTNDSTVLAVDADSGDVKRTLTVEGPVKYHCALCGDLAVFGSFDGKIYVWDFVKDEIKFMLQTEDIVYSRPLISGQRAFIGSADHQFHVIDLKRFVVIKTFDVKEKVHSSPALIGDTVFFGTSGGELIGIHSVSLEITHRFQFPERLTNAAVADGSMIFVYAYDNKMWAIVP